MIIIIPSCGVGNPVSQNSYDINSLLAEEHPIDTNERNIATRICYAYKSKSSNFRSAMYSDKKFNFSVKSKDCQNNESENKVSPILKFKNAQLLYEKPANMDSLISFNEQVQTDTSGYLSVVCAKIINNQVISNTLTISATKVQISFFNDGSDGYLLSYADLQADKSYKVSSAEKYKIITMINYSDGKILGMDQTYTSQKRCGDTKNYSQIEQTFISL